MNTAATSMVAYVKGRSWNHKRLHRVYCALRLNLPRRTTRRVRDGFDSH